MSKIPQEKYDKLGDLIYDWHYEHSGECDMSDLCDISNQVLKLLGFDKGFDFEPKKKFDNIDYNQDVRDEIVEIHKKESVAGVTISSKIDYEGEVYNIDIKIQKDGVVSVGTLF